MSFTSPSMSPPLFCGDFGQTQAYNYEFYLCLMGPPETWGGVKDIHLSSALAAPNSDQRSRLHVGTGVSSKEWIIFLDKNEFG